jgi:hypothetical protein
LPAVTGRLWQSWRQLALPQLMGSTNQDNLPVGRGIRLL